MKNRIMCRLYQFIWQRWLDPADEVVLVRGWRMMTVDNRYHGRRLIMPMFKWEKP